MNAQMPNPSHEIPATEPGLKIWVNGALLPRERAMVSVFDSGFVLGDGVWEGLRLVRGKLVFLDAHLDRLLEGAKALFFDIGLTREDLARALYETVQANGMRDGAHLRLMVTRGERSRPYQSPKLALGRATVVIIPEQREADRALVEGGVKLATVHVRRGYPDVQDPKLNSHSKINCILACIQAQQAGADEAIMLDPHGFVATGNSTHLFIVRKGEVWTSTGRYCIPGITRAAVIRVCREAGIPVFEKDFSLAEVYGAEEAFTTGTYAGIVHAREADGRVFGDGTKGPVVARLQELYAELIAREVEAATVPAGLTRP
jgi:branched-chain amino acid aminotransferase